MSTFEEDAGAHLASVDHDKSDDWVAGFIAAVTWAREHDAKVRAETVEHVAQLATDVLRMFQSGGAGEKNVLPPDKEAGFQLCIDNIANLAKSMKEELK